MNDLVVTPLDVADRLRPVLFKLGRELRRDLQSQGVTPRQVSLLVEIRGARGIGVRELAQRERVSPAGISVQVERLVQAGLVERVADESDRRRHGLRVTPAGDRLLRSVRSRRTAWLATRLQGLEPVDLAAIDRAIEPLLRLLGEKA